MLRQMRVRYKRVLIAIEGVYSMDGDYPGPAELRRDQAAPQGIADGR